MGEPPGSVKTHISSEIMYLKLVDDYDVFLYYFLTIGHTLSLILALIIERHPRYCSREISIGYIFAHR